MSKSQRPEGAMVMVPREPDPILMSVLASIVRRTAIPVGGDSDDVYFDNGMARKLYAAVTDSAATQLSPVSGEGADEPALGRFGHHPDHVIDYTVEVECIQSMVADYELLGLARGDDDRAVSLDDMMRRIWKANGFRVGVDAGALAARRTLVECLTKMERVYAAPPVPSVSGVE